MDDIRHTLFNIFERYKRQKNKMLRDNYMPCGNLFTLTFKGPTKAFLCRQKNNMNEYDRYDFVKYRQLTTNQEEHYLDCSDDEVVFHTKHNFEEFSSCQQTNGE